MPIYEYRCSSCNGQFELLRPMSRADEDASCPTCHNGSHKLLSTFASFSMENNGIPMPVAASGPT